MCWSIGNLVTVGSWAETFVSELREPFVILFVEAFESRLRCAPRAQVSKFLIAQMIGLSFGFGLSRFPQSWPGTRRT